MGLGTLADLMGEDERTIEEHMEPFLLAKDLLARTPRGRAMTPVGLEHLRLHHGWEPNGRTIA